MIYLCTGEYSLDLKSDQIASLFRDQLVITGQDLQFNAGPGQLLHGFPRTLLGRIDECNKADKNHLPFVMNRKLLLFVGHSPVTDRKRAESFQALGKVYLINPLPDIIGKGLNDSTPFCK